MTQGFSRRASCACISTALVPCCLGIPVHDGVDDGFPERPIHVASGSRGARRRPSGRSSGSGGEARRQVSARTICAGTGPVIHSSLASLLSGVARSPDPKAASSGFTSRRPRFLALAEDTRAPASPRRPLRPLNTTTVRPSAAASRRTRWAARSKAAPAPARSGSPGSPNDARSQTLIVRPLRPATPEGCLHCRTASSRPPDRDTCSRSYAIPWKSVGQSMC